MESLFGKEFGGTMPPSLSSPVLSGGVHPSATGTLPRPKSGNSRLTGLFNQPKNIKVQKLQMYLSLIVLVMARKKCHPVVPDNYM